MNIVMIWLNSNRNVQNGNWTDICDKWEGNTKETMFHYKQ